MSPKNLARFSFWFSQVCRAARQHCPINFRIMRKIKNPFLQLFDGFCKQTNILVRHNIWHQFRRRKVYVKTGSSFRAWHSLSPLTYAMRLHQFSVISTYTHTYIYTVHTHSFCYTMGARGSSNYQGMQNTCSDVKNLPAIVFVDEFHRQTTFNVNLSHYRGKKIKIHLPKPVIANYLLK